MKTSIAEELTLFLEHNKSISARRLALEAGVQPASIYHITGGRRSDVQSSTADKLRGAMQRLLPPQQSHHTD